MSTPTRHVEETADHYVHKTSFSTCLRMKSQLVPGTLVICNKMCPILAEEEGVIIDAPELLDGHDCVVKLNNFDKPFGFYWNEVYVL